MKACVLLTALAGGLLVSSGALAEQASSTTHILSPRVGQVVATSDRVMVRMTGPGHPVVAVRSKESGSVWWIQGAGKPEGEGKFSSQVRFGNEQTASGTGYEVTALVAKDSRTANAIKSGTSMNSLPKGVPHSEIVDVVLGHDPTMDDETPTVQAELCLPLPGSRVDRLQNVLFHLEDEDEELPFLVVRSAEVNSLWWVQEPLRRGEDGDLIGIAWIGNSKTPADSKFEMMLVIPKDRAQRKTLRRGVTLRDVSDFRTSETFSVIAIGTPTES